MVTGRLRLVQFSPPTCSAIVNRLCSMFSPLSFLSFSAVSKPVTLLHQGIISHSPLHAFCV